jgi:hypothetical protein
MMHSKAPVEANPGAILDAKIHKNHIRNQHNQYPISSPILLPEELQYITARSRKTLKYPRNIHIYS